MLSFPACFPPQRRSGSLGRVVPSRRCVRGERRRSVILSGGRLRRRRFHAHETKQKGVPRSGGGKRKLLLSPKICQLYLGLLHPKYYQLHPAPLPSKIITQNFTARSLRTALQKM